MKRPYMPTVEELQAQAKADREEIEKLRAEVDRLEKVVCCHDHLVAEITEGHEWCENHGCGAENDS